MTRSNYTDDQWSNFAWMLVMRKVLRKCRTAMCRVSVKAKPHEQDIEDARVLEQEIRGLFPYPWETLK